MERVERRFWHPLGHRKVIGVVVLWAGIMLLALAAGYYGYTSFTSQDLHRLAVHLEVEESLTGLPTLDSASAFDLTSGLARPSPESQVLYPGAVLSLGQWVDPRTAVDPDREAAVLGFTPVHPMGRPIVHGSGEVAHRISIPAIGVDAEVIELGIVDLGESSAYETPKFAVGHIPASSNPGAEGNNWLFGHLESPIRGEGSVFNRLPQIADLLADGEDVFVILYTEQRQYLYRVIATDVLHKDDMDLYGAQDARITLVTCIPRLKYDHRLLVTANLVGYKKS